MTQAAILVVEDESGIAQFVTASLAAAGFAPSLATNAAQAQQMVASQNFALAVVDLGLPDLDGVHLIRQWRATQVLPILVLSARTQEEEKIAALDAGADDYLTKPFSVGELLARVRAQLRRAGLRALPALVQRVGAIEIHREARQVYVLGTLLHLSKTEYDLLERMARDVGKVLTHRTLLSDVWGAEYVDDVHYLRIYMGHLRNKLEINPAEPRYLLTELGVGYRLVEEGDGI